MLKHTCLLLVGLLAVRADMMQMQAMPGSMSAMPNMGMLPPPPRSGSVNMLPPPPPQMTFEQLTQMGVKQSQAAGNSAAVGNAAGLGQGAATSINQANHQAGQGTSMAAGLSANTATGTMGAAANGATQAVGSVNDFAAMQANFGKATQVGGSLLPAQPMSFSQMAGTQQAVKQDQATSSGAAAGNAGAQGAGSASSINQANQQAGNGSTSSSGLSANTATGTQGAVAGGAAQAGGSLSSLGSIQSTLANVQRLKRQVPTLNDILELADASAIGGGSAQIGKIQVQGNSRTNTNRFSASGFASGSAAGQGQGISVFEVAKSDTKSQFRVRRDSDLFDAISEIADASAVGTGKAKVGKVRTSESSRTHTDRFNADGSASGSASGEGEEISILDLAKSNSKSSFSRRARRDLFDSITEIADASALGTGKAGRGKVQNSENSRTHTDRLNADGASRGSASGDGEDISIAELAKSHSESRFSNRQRRQADQLFDSISEIADASALGTGKAGRGKVQNSENSRTHTDRFKADASSSGSASGEGEDITIAELAKGHSESRFSNRQRRQADQLFDSITEIADASALGTGKAGRGKVQNSENSRTHTDRLNADGASRGSASGEGDDISIVELAKSHSESRFANRQRRQADQPFDSISEIADSSALSAGKVRVGKVQAKDSSRTQTDRFRADGSAGASSAGEGEDVSISSLAKSHSESRFSNRQRRQTDQVFDSISEIADASALGTGKVRRGKVQNSENSRTHSDRLNSDASASGSASGEGEDVSVAELVKSHSESRFANRQRRQADLFESISEIADASALGTGKVKKGKVQTSESSRTHTDRLDSDASAAGSASGEGEEVSIVDLAKSHSGSRFSHRARREADLFKTLSDFADASALGGGSAVEGKVRTQNNGSTFSNQLRALGLASGVTFGEGKGINVFDAANTHSQSDFRFKRDTLRRVVNSADGNARGSASVDSGDVSLSETASSNSNLFAASGFASGSAAGSGQGVRLAEVANTEAKSGALRDVVRTPETEINSDASSSARGSGSVDLGSLSSDDQSFSQTRRDSAFSRANANGAGKGRSVKLSESANAHSDTQSVFAAL